jgi:energy-coupling factor transport system ATP-binding protein
MIVCEHLTYRYRDASEPAIKDLSLRVEDGESVCVMGSNGSGKSTLARILAGLLKPTGGSVKIDGEPADKSDGRPKVGMLFQNPDNQMVAMVVDQEVAFALENLASPLPEMKRLVGESLETYGITELENRLTAELSGGEKQRVALAAATVYRPPVLVLDEPDSFLDEAGRRLLCNELERMRETMPVLIEIRVTQYPYIARNYPRLLVIHEGEVIADGEPSKILDDETFCLRVGLKGSSRMGEAANHQADLLVKPAEMKSRPNKIILRNVDFGYSPRQLIALGVSLELQTGEIVGVVGPTGAGKSSLGLVLSGLLRPASGELSYTDGNGQVLSHEARPGWVAAVFQQPERQFFLPTCAKEIAFGPQNLGRRLSDQEISGFLELVGLSPQKFAERDPFSLSVGEKRRLAFAAILSMSPSFTIFDEPTASLDQEGVGRFIGLAKALKSHGMGLVIITHDSEVVQAVADRVIYLPGDRRVETLEVSTLFSDPRYTSVLARPS